MSHTRALRELTGADAPTFGGKSAGLGELLAAGIPVPPGFAIATSAAAEMSEPLRAEICARYRELGDDVPVAVRSSAVGEDSAEATFAGQQDTYLWVRGADAVCGAVRDCWASLFKAEAVAYRARLGGEVAAHPAMGVTVQLMVDAAVSGVMFTCNPLTGDPSMVAINAGWGLGLAVVGGEVTPDDWLVSKVTGEVVREQIGDKAVEYVPGEAGAVKVEVTGDRRARRCLEAAQIVALVEMAKRIERHFGRHQDVEWAFDAGGELYVLQSRPVTALPSRPAAPAPTSALSLVMQKFGAGG